MQFVCMEQRHIICISKSHLSLKITDNVQVLNVLYLTSSSTKNIIYIYYLIYLIY